MRFQIRHQSTNRIRIHLLQSRMSCREADTVCYCLEQLPRVISVKVYETTCDAVLRFRGSSRKLLEDIHGLQPEESLVPAHVLQNSDRTVLAEYKEKLVGRVVLRYGGKLLLPAPLRAAEAVRLLKKSGFGKVVMMTGDNRHTAERIAGLVDVDEYYAEVLPEDKAAYLQKEKAAGRTVVMVGDGINDSPALSAADVGIAISDGAELARELADITISAEDLRSIVLLKEISLGLMAKIRRNYRFIVGFNSALIGLGVMGIITPSASALLHNSSTLAIGIRSMKNLLPGAAE